MSSGSGDNPGKTNDRSRGFGQLHLNINGEMVCNSWSYSWCEITGEMIIIVDDNHYDEITEIPIWAMSKTRTVHGKDIHKFGKVPSRTTRLYNNDIW